MFGYKDPPKLVHRLDQDTSGVLLLARTDRVARGLSEAEADIRWSGTSQASRAIAECAVLSRPR